MTKLDLSIFQHSDKAKQCGLDNSLPDALLPDAIAYIDWFNDSVEPVVGVKQFDSGFRTEALNRVVKGAKGSQHMKAQALDFVPTEDLDEAVLHLQEGVDDFDQLIREPSWLHISHKASGNRVVTLRKTPTGYEPY
jgi:hypothetical protein